MYSSGRLEIAEPFAQIFIDRDEANWAFDLLRNTAVRLGIYGAYDPRFALTLTQRSGRLSLRLNFGGWLVIGFYGPGQSPTRVDLALLADQVAWDERFTSFPFDAKEGEQEVRSYHLPFETICPMTGDLTAAYETTLDFIAQKFQHWKRASHWQQHNPEIAEALFKPEQRERVLAGSLTEAELRYERHMTAFYQDISEEPEVYEVNSIPKNKIYPLSQLAEDTGFDEVELARWVRAIERKGQAILYGPPGTGKTFMAEKLAAHLIGGGDGWVELVQFHPAYAYEDFIQGIRPHSEGDRLSYPIVPGRFLEFCQEAGRRQDRCVLIIDEINRANLSRVFGELMYLLEYRDREISLTGGGRFKIPANVRLIGAMNTADRSIALVDYALRRRFAFLELRPNYDLLRRYHQRQQTGFPIAGLIDLLTGLNRQIGDPHYEVGITFFLHPRLAEEIEDIWRLEIEPYLEEYFFDRPKAMDEWRWSQVKSQVFR